MAWADGVPSRTDCGATAGKQEVIVEFVFLFGWAASSYYPGSGSPFDRDDDCGVVCADEDVSPESVSVGFPPEWMMALADISVLRRQERI